ncbi:hypothetical protein SAMN05443144_113148 [Fodinibius roseus]|uniref:Sigma-70 region 2 n=1 Tax=Fodinibius roseus TaxID=1194090 RepID=A0A1M5ESB2_9BACT|nr:hypothetical protein [Fodinibius roseus]SHF82010.1 hypothetical protein SAMN05443144_113148 [Fodinibius roseus]
MENYYDILFPYAYNILGSRSLAQDAIQEVIARYFSRSAKKIKKAQSLPEKGGD